MFEVIICTKSTGRVQHKAFDTHEEARLYADAWLEKQLNSKRRKVPPSAGEWRITINRLEAPAVRSLERASEAA